MYLSLSFFFMQKKLFIGNLDWGISSEDLAEIFSEFGVVTESIIIKNERGQSKGFGFVTFENGEDADKAIQALDGKEVRGRTIAVTEARPREDRPRDDRRSYNSNRY